MPREEIPGGPRVEGAAPGMHLAVPHLARPQLDRPFAVQGAGFDEEPEVVVAIDRILLPVGGAEAERRHGRRAERNLLAVGRADGHLDLVAPRHPDLDELPVGIGDPEGDRELGAGGQLALPMDAGGAVVAAPATTTIRPGPDSSAITFSSRAVPSWDPWWCPRLRLITAGRRPARAKILRIAQMVWSSKSGSLCATIRSAPGATPQ